jgi:hypothetical protein
VVRAIHIGDKISHQRFVGTEVPVLEPPHDHFS